MSTIDMHQVKDRLKSAKDTGTRINEVKQNVNDVTQNVNDVKQRLNNVEATLNNHEQKHQDTYGFLDQLQADLNGFSKEFQKVKETFVSNDTLSEFSQNLTNSLEEVVAQTPRFPALNDIENRVSELENKFLNFIKTAPNAPATSSKTPKIRLEIPKKNSV